MTLIEMQQTKVCMCFMFHPRSSITLIFLLFKINSLALCRQFRPPDQPRHGNANPARAFQRAVEESEAELPRASDGGRGKRQCAAAAHGKEDEKNSQELSGNSEMRRGAQAEGMFFAECFASPCLTGGPSISQSIKSHGDGAQSEPKLSGCSKSSTIEAGAKTWEWLNFFSAWVTF